MECKVCSSPDVTTVARVGNLKLVLCTACQELEEWVRDHVQTVRELIEPDSPYCPDDLLYILGVVEEFAKKLGVTL
jgi:hypothetical protein